MLIQVIHRSEDIKSSLVLVTVVDGINGPLAQVSAPGLPVDETMVEPVIAITRAQIACRRYDLLGIQILADPEIWQDQWLSKTAGFRIS